MNQATRRAALMLIPFLVADPATAAALQGGNVPAKFTVLPKPSNLFTEQAVVQYLLNGRLPYFRKLRVQEVESIAASFQESEGKAWEGSRLPRLNVAEELKVSIETPRIGLIPMWEETFNSVEAQPNLLSSAKLLPMSKFLTRVHDSVYYWDQRTSGYPRLRGAIGQMLSRPENRQVDFMLVKAGVLKAQMGRYYNPKSKRAVIAIDEKFYGATIGGKTVMPGGQRVFIERLFHEFEHSDKSGTYEEEVTEEKDVLREWDLFSYEELGGNENGPHDPDVEAFLTELSPEIKPFVTGKGKFVYFAETLKRVRSIGDPGKREELIRRALTEYASRVVSGDVRFGKAAGIPDDQDVPAPASPTPEERVKRRQEEALRERDWLSQLQRAVQNRRIPLIGGNWKMAAETQTPAGARALTRAVGERVGRLARIEVFIAPSPVHLPTVRDELANMEEEHVILRGTLRLAAQDMSSEDPGAQTGEVSYAQLKDQGVSYIILGHSERRRDLGESSEWINKKVRTALREGFKVVVCVGETQEERDAHLTFAVLQDQIRKSLAGLNIRDMQNVVIAYEPVWAIGTGKTATKEDADMAQEFIRGLMTDLFNEDTAAQVRILYGGSMKVGNAQSLMKQPNLDGGLIGGAALDATQFASIVSAAKNPGIKSPGTPTASLLAAMKQANWQLPLAQNSAVASTTVPERVPVHDAIWEARMDVAEKAHRKPVIGGNWKMNLKNEGEALVLGQGVLRELESVSASVDVFVAPSFPHLETLRKALAANAPHSAIDKGRIKLAAQDVSAEKPGAHTGQVSAEQLKAMGVSYVIVGHSERRRGAEFRESSSVVNRKARRALGIDLNPVVCIGETFEERSAGITEQVLALQIKESLAGVTAEEMKGVVIAYEPVWAIGTGRTATKEDANQTQRFVRGRLLDLFGDVVAAETRIQYGGSMNPANADGLIRQPNIDGGLIGGAALKADQFGALVKTVERHSLDSNLLRGFDPLSTGGGAAGADLPAERGSSYVRSDEVDYAELWNQTRKPLLVMVNMDMLNKDGTEKGRTKIIEGLQGLETIARQIPIVFITHVGRKPKSGAEKQALSTERIVTIINKEIWKREIPVSSVPGLTDESGIDEHLGGLKPGEASFLPNYREHSLAEAGDAGARRQLAHNILYDRQGQLRYAAVMQNDFASAPRDTAEEGEIPSTRLMDIPLQAGLAFAGPLFVRETTALQPARAMKEDKVVVIVAGSKVKDKIVLLEKVVQKMRKGHQLHIGGLMSYTFLKARSDLQGVPLQLGGTSGFVEKMYLEKAIALLQAAANKGVNVVLPEDHVVADNKTNPTWVGVTKNVNIPDNGWYALDEGPATRQKRAQAIRAAKLIVINGPVGVYETRVNDRKLVTTHTDGLDPRLLEFDGDSARPFATGSDKVFSAASDAVANHGAKAYTGGGDTEAAMGMTEEANHILLRISHRSTGGASTQQYISLLPGEEWPPEAALRQVEAHTRARLPLIKSHPEPIAARPAGTSFNYGGRSLLHSMSQRWFTSGLLHPVSLEGLRDRVSLANALQRNLQKLHATNVLQIKLKADKLWALVFQAIGQGNVGGYKLEFVGVDTLEEPYLIPASGRTPELRVFGLQLAPGEQDVPVPTFRIFAPRSDLERLQQGRGDPALVQAIWHEIAQIHPKGQAHWVVSAFEEILFRRDTLWGAKTDMSPRRAADLARAVERSDEPYLQQLANSPYDESIESELRSKRNPGTFSLAKSHSEKLALAAVVALSALATEKLPAYTRLSLRDKEWIRTYLRSFPRPRRTQVNSDWLDDILATLLLEVPMSDSAKRVADQCLSELKAAGFHQEEALLTVRAATSPHRFQLSSRERDEIDMIVGELNRDHVFQPQVPINFENLLAWVYLRSQNSRWSRYKALRALSTFGIYDDSVRSAIIRKVLGLVSKLDPNSGISNLDWAHITAPLRRLYAIPNTENLYLQTPGDPTVPPSVPQVNGWLAQVQFQSKRAPNPGTTHNLLFRSYDRFSGLLIFGVAVPVLVGILFKMFVALHSGDTKVQAFAPGMFIPFLIALVQHVVARMKDLPAKINSALLVLRSA